MRTLRLEPFLLLGCWLEVSTCFVPAGPRPSSRRTSYSQSHSSTSSWLHRDLTIEAPLTQLWVSFTPNQFDIKNDEVDASAYYGVTSTSSRDQADLFADGSVKPSLNLPLFRSICESQVFMLMVAVTLFAVSGGRQSLLPSMAMTPSFTELPLASLMAAGITFLLSILFHEWTAHSSYRPASHIEFATKHLVHTLFGRRSSSTTTTAEERVDMLVTVAISGFLALLTAVCQEVSFRGFFLAAILQQTATMAPSLLSLMAALVGQAIVYAAVMTASNESSVNAAHGLSLAFKFITGMLLGGMVVASHSLWPSILVQWLINWHLWSKTWMHVNHHMDWVEQQELPTDSCARSNVKLPPDLHQSLYRFFCAFDSAHQHALSISDVQRAVSFAFWHSESSPSQEQVRNLAVRSYDYFHLQSNDELEERTDNADKDDDDDDERVRLNFEAFLAVLFALRRQSITGTNVRP